MFVLKTRSRNKFGMTVFDNSENVTSGHSELDSESRPQVFSTSNIELASSIDSRADPETSSG
ncbi:hypothetical protein V513_14340 [Mesotoga sp. H07.pep.5.3]|nr:hypothetical protein V513_14340 [Mesotoga sp. H07.pep.5.3]